MEGLDKAGENVAQTTEQVQGSVSMNPTSLLSSIVKDEKDDTQSSSGQDSQDPEKPNGDVQEEEEIAIVDEVLANIGILDVDPEFFNELPENVDVDSTDGIEYVVRRAMQLGAKMYHEEQIAGNPLINQVITHLKNGGTLDNLNGEVLMPYELSSVKGNIETQKAVFREYYKGIGIDSDSAEILLSKAIADESLEEKSLKFAEKRNQTIQDRVLERQKAIEEKEAKRVEYVNTLDSTIQKHILQNDFFAGIKIPDTKRDEFYNYFVNSLSLTDDSAYFVIDMNSAEQIKQALTVAYNLKYGNQAQQNNNAGQSKSRTLARKKAETIETKPQKVEDKIDMSDFLRIR